MTTPNDNFGEISQHTTDIRNRQHDA